MFDTKIAAPTNEQDVKLAEIELEKIKEITKQLPEYIKLFTPTKESGRYIINMCNITASIEKMDMADYM